jgi:hypothetical protein
MSLTSTLPRRRKSAPPKKEVEETAERLPADVKQQAQDVGKSLEGMGVKQPEASREATGEMASPTTPGQLGTDGQYDRVNPVAEKYAGAPPREQEAEKAREAEREQPERE